MFGLSLSLDYSRGAGLQPRRWTTAAALDYSRGAGLQPRRDPAVVVTGAMAPLPLPLVS